MTTKNLGPREIPSTEAARCRNNARTIVDRIAQRGRATKDQSRSLRDWLARAEQAELEAAELVGAGI